MTPTNLLLDVIDPGLDYMVKIIGTPNFDSPEARVMLLAIAGQEGNFKERIQIGGPARSYWQFERGGGLAGVMANTHTAAWLHVVCDALDVEYNSLTIFEAMAWNDHLAVTLARLNLWLVRGPLPAIGAQAAAWAYYENQWAPGKSGPTRWPSNYQSAISAVKANP